MFFRCWTGTKHVHVPITTNSKDCAALGDHNQVRLFLNDSRQLSRDDT